MSDNYTAMCARYATVDDARRGLESLRKAYEHADLGVLDAAIVQRDTDGKLLIVDGAPLDDALSPDHAHGIVARVALSLFQGMAIAGGALGGAGISAEDVDGTTSGGDGISRDDVARLAAFITPGDAAVLVAYPMDQSTLVQQSLRADATAVSNQIHVSLADLNREIRQDRERGTGPTKSP